MKKILTLTIAIIMLCTMTSCTKKAPTADDTAAPVTETATPIPEAPTPEAPTESVQPSSAPQPTPAVVNLLETMSHGEKTELNQFLSNFSEAYYGDGYRTEAEDKIHFAFIHNMINGKHDSIIYTDSEMGISANDVDTVLNRFFGSSVAHETPEGSTTFEYKDGNFMMPAASGESYAYFSIATDMREHTNGNYIVKFSVFFDDNNPHDMLQSWYSLTYDEAISSSQYDYCYDGEAILKAKNDTYEVVSYKRYE